MEAINVLVIACAALDIAMIIKGDRLWPLFLGAFFLKVPLLAKIIGG